jgi:hypothetical protein
MRIKDKDKWCEYYDNSVKYYYYDACDYGFQYKGVNYINCNYIPVNCYDCIGIDVSI